MANDFNIQKKFGGQYLWCYIHGIKLMITFKFSVSI